MQIDEFEACKTDEFEACKQMSIERVVSVRPTAGREVRKEGVYSSMLALLAEREGEHGEHNEHSDDSGLGTNLLCLYSRGLFLR